MADYATYDEGLPCKNPHCKSHGRPHPNCKCYAGAMAEGGEVKHYCEEVNAHKPECEYFEKDPLHQDSHLSAASYLVSEGLHGLIHMNGQKEDALDRYNHSVRKGKLHFEKKIDHLFEGKMIEKKDHEKSKKLIHDWIEKGGSLNDIQEHIYSPETQYLASGGEAKVESKLLHDHPVQEAYPEQNMMLQAAKGRMSNYLNGLKPQENTPRLAFDRKPDDKQQKKTYEKALHIAAHPLSVLEDLQKGTLGPEQINHLKNLHPEVNDVMQEKLTERVTKDQINHKRPSHKVRQGLSLLLGAPLSSDMTPQNMQAIQATFQAKQQSQQQASSGNKKNTSVLTKVDDSYLTSNQARVSRGQKQ